MDNIKMIEVLEMISEDMANDAESFDGRPFNGRTVAEYFGNQGAAISALARIMKYIISDKSTPTGTEEPSPVHGCKACSHLTFCICDD